MFASTVDALDISWRCRHTWKRASQNTGWCLTGCAIGDFGTIAYFQFMGALTGGSSHYVAGDYKWDFNINRSGDFHTQ